MLAILLDHTEVYYTGENIINYNFYVSNALTLFFFISGYLCFKEPQLDLQSKLISIVHKLLIPYFSFTTIIALPKALIHNYDIGDTFLSIILGHASWFIVTLIVSELVLTFILWISKGNHWILSILSLFSFVTAINLSEHKQTLFWQINNATLAFPILYLGYLFHLHEKKFNFINTPLFSIFSLILLIIIKIYAHDLGANQVISPIVITHPLLFIADVSIATLCFIGIAKQCPDQHWLQWVGKYSLIYYFLSGGIPLLISRLLNSTEMAYSGQYIQVIIAFILVSITATFITHVIARFCPWLIGKSRLTENKKVDK